jgi:hypothetical protein
MLHKLRQIMGKRDEQYSLTDVIELDEVFFSTEVEEDEKDKPLKRGRGSQKKSKVPLEAECNWSFSSQAMFERWGMDSIFP